MGMEAEAVTERRADDRRQVAAWPVVACLAGGALSGLAALLHHAPSAAGVVVTPATVLLMAAPLLEEHLKLAGVALARRLGVEFTSLRTFGGWMGLGFALSEAALVSAFVMEAGHGAVLWAVVTLRLLLTVPLHVGTGWLHGRAMEGLPRGGFTAVYRHGSGAAILLHAAYNATLMGLKSF